MKDKQTPLTTSDTSEDSPSQEILQLRSNFEGVTRQQIEETPLYPGVRVWREAWKREIVETKGLGNIPENLQKME